MTTTHHRSSIEHDDLEQQRREQSVTDDVVRSFTRGDRYSTVMRSLVQHLHEFIRDVRLTTSEWESAMNFLKEAGEITSPSRQEFVLLSDVLGLSMLTVCINEPARGEATESTVFGPFFVDDAPYIERGGDLSGVASGQPCWVEGRVTDLDGAPVAQARIDVWEADDDGKYDVQYDDGRTAGRAYLFTDEDGRYGFWCVRPTPYPIPNDGPVGRMLEATGRGPERAAHLHFMVQAEGKRTLITHIFVEGGEYLDCDAVFGVKESLIVEFVTHPAGAVAPGGRRLSTDWSSAEFDIVLAPAEDLR